MKEVTPIIKQGWLRAILFALTFLALIIFSSMATERLLQHFNLNKPEAGDVNDLSGLVLLIRVCISLAVTVLTVFFFRKLIDKQDLISLGLHIKNNLSHAAVGFFLGLLLLGSGAFILIANKNLQWTNINFNPSQLSIGLGVMIIIAFTEEFVFRGYILNNLMLSMNKWMALFYSALLFALFHMGNPGVNVLSLVNVFLAGLLLGINYIFTKNLWFGIFFHFAWNFYQGSVLGFKVSGISLKSLFEQQLTGNSLLTGGAFGFEGSILTAALLVVALLSLAWIYRKRYEL